MIHLRTLRAVRLLFLSPVNCITLDSLQWPPYFYQNYIDTTNARPLSTPRDTFIELPLIVGPTSPDLDRELLLQPRCYQFLDLVNFLVRKRPR